MSELGNDRKELLKNFGKREVVVGIPSYNNEASIAFVALQAGKGIEQYFNGNGCILNCDGGSQDKTQKAFLETHTHDIPKASFPYEGIPGKGNALRAMMEGACLLDAKVLVFVDSDLRSITPEWIFRLAKPILDRKACYVAPFYQRHKYDGTITNQICFPLTSILYGKEVRQPIGGDFGVSREMMEVYLAQPPETWAGDVARFGIDIWMTTMALNEGKKPLYQAALGAKIHDVRDPGKHLGPMFSQVVGTLFALMGTYKHRWMQQTTPPEKVSIFGIKPATVVEPLSVDLENLKKKAREGVELHTEFLQQNLAVQYLPILGRVKETGSLPSEEWLKFVFMISHAIQNSAYKTQWMEGLIPFYFARVADFVQTTQDFSEETAEVEVKKQMHLAWSMRQELHKIWES